MSTQQDAYEVEVRRIAEIIARTPYNPEKWNDIEWFGSGVKEALIDAKMDEACAMVAEMESKVTLAMTSVLGSSDSAKLEISIILSVFGLIPSPTKTGKNDI